MQECGNERKAKSKEQRAKSKGLREKRMRECENA
jgi:hypothetical protein